MGLFRWIYRRRTTKKQKYKEFASTSVASAVVEAIRKKEAKRVDK
jgi:hypothetical protein